MILARLLTIAFLMVGTVAMPSQPLPKEKKQAENTVVTNNTAGEGKALLDYITKRCNANRIPVRLVHNVIHVESKWRFADDGDVVGSALVQSSEDAYGLMQIQLPTAQDMMETDTITAQDLMSNNILNVECGIRYLAWLRNYYDGNWYFAIAAYNRGILNVNRDIKNGYKPLNDYVYTVSTSVFFGKKTTRSMETALAKLANKSSFAQEVIAEVTLLKASQSR